jgi:hypothetical protein
MSAHPHGLTVGGGTVCKKCHEPVFEADGSYDFSEEKLVINLWSCTSCGHRFETELSETAPAPMDIPGGTRQKSGPALIAA